MIIINFKNYKRGKETLKLAKLIEKINKNIIVAVPSGDLEEVSKKTKLKVYAQHVDYREPGKGTGYVIPEELKSLKVKGSIINHSEHRIPKQAIKKTIQRLKKLKLKSIVCAKNLKEVKEFKKLKPYAIAYEDPKLISTKKSITEYNKESVIKFSKLLKNTKIIPICGAGINKKEDIEEAKKLGCKGVLIASAIANVKNPEKLLKQL
ncbi:MAG: triose-phosphate isomerase [Candidatus Woesearchaeota archaeon]